MDRKVVWTSRARRDLRAIDATSAERIRQAIDDLMSTNRGDVRLIRGRSTPTWRLRVGSWRVLYEMDTSAVEVTFTIQRILLRRDAYRS